MSAISFGQKIKSRIPPPLFSALKWAYFSIIGLLGPRYAYWRLRRSCKNPHTYGEKVRYKIAFDRNPLLITMADKIKVRELVAEIIGPKYLIKAHATSYNPHEIDWDSLPREFVAKSNHGASGSVIVWDGADPETRLPKNVNSIGWKTFLIRPENVVREDLVKLLKHFLTLKYSWHKYKATPEWAYGEIKPGILIEELLQEPDGQLPSDYKFTLVNGKVTVIWVISGRNSTGVTFNCFDSEWNLLPFAFISQGMEYVLTVPTVPKPGALKEMIEIAEKFGHLTDSMRVDLYYINEKIFFGELTVYPTAGDVEFRPESFNQTIGSEWIPSYPR